MTHHHLLSRGLPLAAVAAAALAITGCGSNTGSPSAASTSPASTTASATTASGGSVMPVPANPIDNTSTAPGLTITKALVENNVSPDTGKGTDDHLEVALKNTTSKPLAGVEIYYAITDPAKKLTEGYHTTLDGFTIEPGKTRVAHFDNTGAPDHYPVNKYSLYYADKNALVVDVQASARGLAPADFTVKKDAGGAEAGVE